MNEATLTTTEWVSFLCECQHCSIQAGSNATSVRIEWLGNAGKQVCKAGILRLARKELDEVIQTLQQAVKFLQQHPYPLDVDGDEQPEPAP